MNPTRIFCLKSFVNIFKIFNYKNKVCLRKFSSFHNSERNSIFFLTSNSHNLFTTPSRYLPKNKDKPRNKEKKIELREDLIDEYLNYNNIKTNMELAIEDLKHSYIQNVSLRSSTGSIESLTVEFEGEEFKIQDLAQINRKNPKIIALNLTAFPQTIPAVLDALHNSGMNLNAQQDGTSIYVPIPKVTREHRENLAKSANILFLKCKEKIRNIQSKSTKQLDFKIVEGLSKEKYFIIRDQLTALADKYISEAEEMKNNKQKELLQTKS